ncbi:MAG: hypothetical protein JWO42_1869, partial [Chloroflexi bacterium]|nr:hypothetical protein [Chloroflexota bacterium]
MDQMFAALARFSVRFKYPVAIAWIVITVVSIRAFPSLASVTKDTNSGFLPSSTPSIQASNLAAPFQNINFYSAIIYVVRNDCPLTPADQSAI